MYTLLYRRRRGKEERRGCFQKGKMEFNNKNPLRHGAKEKEKEERETCLQTRREVAVSSSSQQEEKAELCKYVDAPN